MLLQVRLGQGLAPGLGAGETVAIPRAFSQLDPEPASVPWSSFEVYPCIPGWLYMGWIGSRDGTNPYPPQTSQVQEEGEMVWEWTPYFMMGLSSLLSPRLPWPVCGY